MATIITAEHITKVVDGPRGELRILDDVNLTIAAGEQVAITGVSGSGKTTLLSLLAGLDVPSAGRIVLRGQDLTSLDEDGRARLRRELVGFVFQAFHLIPSFTALENVMLPLELQNAKNTKVRARELLERVGLDDRLDHYPRQLSGGEQQRVALARAFSTEPEILFADEPTGNLDAINAKTVAELMFELHTERGGTLVVVTHDLELAAACDRQIALGGGRLIEA
jgi:putative ABC transport system ATP-binding protein